MFFSFPMSSSTPISSSECSNGGTFPADPVPCRTAPSSHLRASSLVKEARVPPLLRFWRIPCIFLNSSFSIFLFFSSKIACALRFERGMKKTPLAVASTFAPLCSRNSTISSSFIAIAKCSTVSPVYMPWSNNFKASASHIRFRQIPRSEQYGTLTSNWRTLSSAFSGGGTSVEGVRCSVPESSRDSQARCTGGLRSSIVLVSELYSSVLS
mmetsp:Transcript_62112/g.152829  ORF Transcript_62112/g.152829 Transcript_62112/m.152829 type:complete len:211 (-) Transcript_62112:1510-2142(-)